MYGYLYLFLLSVTLLGLKFKDDMTVSGEISLFQAAILKCGGNSFVLIEEIMEMG